MYELPETKEHPLRRELNDEVHARPPDSLATPSQITYLTRLPDRSDGERPNVEVLSKFLAHFDVAPPQTTVKHFAADIGAVRLRWERHTEYSRYTLARNGEPETPFTQTPGDLIPDAWMDSITGYLLIGVQAQVIRMDDWRDRLDEISATFFDGNVLVGSVVADDGAVALTDLRIHGDGMSRILLINEAMSEQQTGRVMQRLLEIETYRMMSLLALPVAQQLTPVLDESEEELTLIGEALVDAEMNQEQALLERLTRLSATSQHRHLRSNYRFDAADAYYEIVLQRIHELRETRIVGVQTFEEFTNRRLAPAVKTYRAVSRRQQSILEQMARATKLLSTRIDIARQRQNQSLLASMNRRVKTQLRLQATVEGLSVAAVTYYIVGLINLLAKGLVDSGLPVSPAIVTGVSIPIVATSVYMAVRRLRKKISAEESE
ncbi:MAG: DUF3422 domain-containing protein [Woeseiaceae bacterium]|nr:DUF3422 domain-containing protein [Woeseiaceae bacterium]